MAVTGAKMRGRLGYFILSTVGPVLNPRGVPFGSGFGKENKKKSINKNGEQQQAAKCKEMNLKPPLKM